jgi:hypothetical protein
LKKSKIENSEKSREGQFFIVSAAASLRKAGTKVCGRFCVNRYGPSRRRARDVSGADKFRSPIRKDFFNSIDPGCVKTLISEGYAELFSQLPLQKEVASAFDFF